jgi:hypothetical protein
MIRLYLLVLVAIACLMISPLYGGIIIVEGNNPQPDENVLFNETGLITTGNPVQGITNQSGLLVQFESDEDLTTPSGGQARIEADDGDFTNFTFSVPGGTFLSYIFNLSTLDNATGTAIITAWDDDDVMNVFSETFDIGGGQNFFTVYAINDQRIASVNVVSTIPLENVAQNRVGGALMDGGEEIPEPGTYALVAAGIAALVYFRRRKVA